MKMNKKKKLFLVNGGKKIGIVRNALLSFIHWSPVRP